MHEKVVGNTSVVSDIIQLLSMLGVSFLNIGSGTGYLSTMAGFLIGPYGINHGIEIYPDNVDYAYEKLTEFRETSPWYDPMEFCEPLFVVGNGLLLSPGNILYDRIYCGAACPPEHAQLMKNMLNIGGILVMPHDNQVDMSVQCLCVYTHSLCMCGTYCLCMYVAFYVLYRSSCVARYRTALVCILLLTDVL